MDTQLSLFPRGEDLPLFQVEQEEECEYPYECNCMSCLVAGGSSEYAPEDRYDRYSKQTGFHHPDCQCNICVYGAEGKRPSEY